MEPDRRITERIAQDYSVEEQPVVTELLKSYVGREAARVSWDILVLSKGSVADVRRYVQSAHVDYRDVLYWAEYYENDSMLRGRDPRALVDEILAKWGEPESR